MPSEQLLLLIAFVVAMTGTPGPNNVILMTTGANCGFWRSVPHLCGIAVGSQFLLFAIAWGMEGVLLRWPESMTVLRVSGSLFLLYMAVQMVRPPRPAAALLEGTPGERVSVTGRPLTFWQAVLFQWINPKSWLMCVTAVATFADPDRPGSSMMMVALAFLVFGSLLTGIWSAAGMMLRSWLQKGRRLVRFNQVMAAMLVVSIYPLVM